MHETTYTDRDGRRWRRLLPDDVGTSQAKIGIPAGPPPLDRLRLPLELEIRLHNELHDRALFGLSDLRGRTEELRSAIMAAIRLDVQLLQECYAMAPLTAEPIGT